MSTDDKPNKYFSMGLRGNPETAKALLQYYPMPATNKKAVKESRLIAVNTILSNQIKGDVLKVRNISKEPGRTILLQVFNHMVEHGLITRSVDTMLSSEIKYQPLAKLYLPAGIVYTPRHQIYYRPEKKENRTHMNLDTPEKKELAARLSAWWHFIEQQDIKHNISQEYFDLLNRYQVEVCKKEPLNYPEQTKIKPYFSFNNKEMTKGGRLYGAWWTGANKRLRKQTTINGELTSDVDGRGMHVQLLYREANVKFPDHDPYVYQDETRTITKQLMLLMMNTKKDYEDRDKGRKAVAYTYAKSRDCPKVSRDRLIALMKELEQCHEPIINYLYKSNWGRLQMVEAQIMMNIMEAGMKENIPILPVHDGCLCPRSAKSRVVELFNEQGIEAAENQKHLIPLPEEELRQILRQDQKLKLAA
ncbi:hypothetical protein [Desulfocastanea catecholica]